MSGGPGSTAGSNVDPAYVQGAGGPPVGQVSAAIPEPSAIGVPKYATIGGHYIFKGTTHAQVIQGVDGKFYAIDSTGAVLVGGDGKPIEDKPATDRSNTPIRVQAQYTTPGALGSQLPGITSRIEPGSPATGQQPGSTGPARYEPGADWAIFAQLAPEERVQVQQQMIDRGVSPTNATANGVFDTAWLNSFQTILGYANANNQDWQSALRSMPPIDRSTSTVKDVSPSVYHNTVPASDDLAAVFKKAYADTIGGGSVDQSVVDNYVRAYQQMVRNDDQAKMDAEEKAKLSTQRVTFGADGRPVPATVPGTDLQGILPDSAATATGPNPTGLPQPIVTESSIVSPEQFAKNTIKQQYAGRFHATNEANAYSLFMNSIAGLGANRAPSTQGQVT